MKPKNLPGTGTSSSRGLSVAKGAPNGGGTGSDESGLDDDDLEEDEETTADADAEADEEDDDEMEDEDEDEGAKASAEEDGDDEEDEEAPTSGSDVRRNTATSRRAVAAAAASVSSPASSLRSHTSRNKGKSKGVNGRRKGCGEDTPSEMDDDDDGDDDDLGDDDDDEEDSSDMDAQECEKKRIECIDDLAELEKQFAILREQLYRERISQIETKLTEVRSGKALEYLNPLEELQVNMKTRLEVGSILRELRLANIHCKFEAEMLATEQNYRSEKEMLWDSLKSELEEKIHMLEEDKHNIDFSMWELSTGKTKRRKADMSDSERRRPVTVAGPFIVYMLREEDILDDWTSIRKSLTQKKKIDAKA